MVYLKIGETTESHGGDSLARMVVFNGREKARRPVSLPTNEAAPAAAERRLLLNSTSIIAEWGNELGGKGNWSPINFGASVAPSDETFVFIFQNTLNVWPAWTSMSRSVSGNSITMLSLMLIP